jgi:hypothetical protein
MWTMFALRRTAVSSSMAEYKKPPSPEIERTFSAGRTIDAATAQRRRPQRKLLV